MSHNRPQFNVRDMIALQPSPAPLRTVGSLNRSEAQQAVMQQPESDIGLILKDLIHDPLWCARPDISLRDIALQYVRTPAGSSGRKH